MIIPFLIYIHTRFSEPRLGAKRIIKEQEFPSRMLIGKWLPYWYLRNGVGLLQSIFRTEFSSFTRNTLNSPPLLIFSDLNSIKLPIKLNFIRIDLQVNLYFSVESGTSWSYDRGIAGAKG